MENPATWGLAEYAVEKVLHEYYEEMQKPPAERRIGFSLVMQITGALREAGLLR